MKFAHVRMTLIVSTSALANTNSGLGAANPVLRLGASSAKSFSEICESQSNSSSPEPESSAPTRPAVWVAARNFFPAKGASPKPASNSAAPSGSAQTISATLTLPVAVPIPDPVATELGSPTSTLSGLPGTTSSPNLTINQIDPTSSSDGNAQVATDPTPLPDYGSRVPVASNPAIRSVRAMGSNQEIGSTPTIASGENAGYTTPQPIPSTPLDTTQGQTLASMHSFTVAPASPRTAGDTAPTDTSVDPQPPQSVYAALQGNDWIGQATTSAQPGAPIGNVPSIEPSSDSNGAQAAAKLQPSDQTDPRAPDPTKQDTIGTGEIQSASSDPVSNNGRPQPSSSTGMNSPDDEPAEQSSNVVPSVPVSGKNTGSAGVPKKVIAASKPRFETARSAKDATGTETVSDSAEPAQSWIPTAVNLHFQVDASVVPNPVRIVSASRDGAVSPPSTSTESSTIPLRPATPVDGSGSPAVSTANNNAASPSTVSQNSTQQSQSKETSDPKNQGTVTGSLDAAPALAPVLVTPSLSHDPKSVAAPPSDSPTQKPDDSSASSDVGFNRAPTQPLPATATASPVQLAQMLTKASQAEMRIGLNTQAFGNVEVRTVVHATDVGVLIGSEKGDLRSLLTNDLPGIANTLQQQNLRLTQVSFQQQGFTASSDSSSGGNAQPRSFATRSNSTGIAPVELRPEDSEQTFEARSDRGLSILA